MMKRKIGILVFTDRLKARGTRKNLFFDSEKYRGFRYIISEIDKQKNEIKYISKKQIKECDFVLVSLTSYMDVKNLVNELQNVDKGNAKIIVGGAGVTNIRLYKHLIDYACFGRGEFCINRIFEGDLPNNVWSKEDDFDLKKKYKIGECKTFIGDEISVGCKRKCYFCQYSWKNKYISKNEENYNSGYSEYEDFFNTFDWGKATKYVVTALDGIDEFAREKVNKRLSKEEIVKKIQEGYRVKTDKRLSVKVYMIIGYPWENKDSANLEELKEILKKADRPKKGNKIFFHFLFTHFVPMQLTPMYYMPLNFVNYREELIKNRNYIIYDGNNIKAYISEWITTPATAFDNLYVERAYEEDYDNYIKIFNTKKYMLLPTRTKIEVIKRYANSKLYEENYNIPVDYLIPNYDYKKTKYLKRQ